VLESGTSHSSLLDRLLVKKVLTLTEGYCIMSLLIEFLLKKK